MPHLTLEYSANIDQPIDFKGLFSKLHQVLAEVADIDIENCKSRAMRLEEYHMAAGESDRAFIHLEVSIFQGRSLSLKQVIGNSLLDILGECFKQSFDQLNLQITVEIKDVQKTLYFKLPVVKDG